MVEQGIESLRLLAVIEQKRQVVLPTFLTCIGPVKTIPGRNSYCLMWQELLLCSVFLPSSSEGTMVKLQWSASCFSPEGSLGDQLGTCRCEDCSNGQFSRTIFFEKDCLWTLSEMPSSDLSLCSCYGLCLQRGSLDAIRGGEVVSISLF